MIQRLVDTDLETYIQGDSKKIFFLWGPRRSGKTTLLQQLSEKHNTPIFDFDLQSDRDIFVPDRDVLSRIVKEHTLILIDEVQNYPESTVVLKLLHDLFSVKIVATGSSELRQKRHRAFDSLAGRFEERYCFPLAFDELVTSKTHKAYDISSATVSLSESMQQYGGYPEVYLEQQDAMKIDLLQNLLNTYVLKDIVAMYDLRDTKLASDVLTKIALQIGSEVSVREIASGLQASVPTVLNYIEIFIKNYILLPLPSFKTNARRALSEKRKLYFYDVGLRNMLVKDFRPTSLRPDSGGVFENFIVSEIEKWRRNHHAHCSLYFYREYGGKEVDLVIEDYRKRYTVVEIKRTSGKVKSVFPLPHKSILITSKNYADEIPRLMP